ncbi:MAG: NAD(P)/FAD-dependent oxidoreductase [Actinomycetota bacterium]
MDQDYRAISFWHDSAGEELRPRAPLPGPTDADAVIIGAGYTGLWTAYYLKTLQPDLRIVIVESEIAGYGASGRNGGWCAGEIAGSRQKMAGGHGREAVVALWRQMFATVDEVGKVVAETGIDCHFHKGGILTFATGTAHFQKLHRRLQYERSWGFGPDDFTWMGPQEIEAVARVAGSQGALFTPHAAAIHPLRLARGLARAVEDLGVRIYEHTRAVSLRPGKVRTIHGTVKADVVLRCTEAFTVNLPGRRRTFIPIYSLMIATEPLSASFWSRVGFADRQVFNDARHLIMYGQRTADGRLAFGARGARYHFGSDLRSEYDRQPRVHGAIKRLLWNLFPDLGPAEVTHEWGGAVAAPRDWRPSVYFDQVSGMGDAGGYVGEGVAASNLAGRTLADVILSRDTDLVRLPWVGHRSPRWEPEPLRWLGVNAATMLAPAADAAERRSGRPSRLFAAPLRRLIGK